MPRIFNRPDRKRLRQNLRNSQTPAEQSLWLHIRRRQIKGFKFRRQFSVGPYVIDFYCPELKLAIELDGDSHFRTGARLYDQRRDDYLRSLGIHVVRYLNSEIHNNLDNLLDHLTEIMEQISNA